MTRIACTLILLLSAIPIAADEGHHHEEITPEQLGTVHFPVSCAVSVQAPFERGVALLHSFWYEEAEKSFEQIAKDDPSCAMAHWGVAMSLWHQLWDRPQGETLKHGLDEAKRGAGLHPKTDRERDYLAAIRTFYADGRKDHQVRAEAYSKAMEQMNRRYPDDKEAAAFYALSLLAAEPDEDTTFANRKKAVEVLNPLFASEPNHPGVAHYLIHSCDKPQLAELGLPAARRYAQIAPAAPHALHMPSHIFARVGAWQDDIDSNLASIAATRKTAAMHMGGEDHQFHAMDFLVYAYLQIGHEADAKKVIEEVRTMPPVKPSFGGSYNAHHDALSSFPATYAIELHRWSEAAALTPVPDAAPSEHAITYWARAIGSARAGNLEEARKDVAELEGIRKQLDPKKRPYAMEFIGNNLIEANAWIHHAEGKDEEAVAALRPLADKQDALGEESLWISARQMLADILLEMKRPQEALAEYQTDLKNNPNRFNTLYGAAQAAEAAGKTEQANTYYATLVRNCDGSNSDRPELARAKSLIVAKN
jgi:tetratricopeptide (TPR) repeat protein